MSSEETKGNNKKYIEELQKENRELKKFKEDIVANRKAAYTAGMAKIPGATYFHSNDENQWKKSYDTISDKVRRRKKVLLRLKDKLNEVSDVKNAAFEESPLTRQIRILENKLDKIMIKYNEAQSIRKTYEQIVKRLKEERIGYDNQLAAIERSLKGKEHDYVELLLLSHDATHAKELALSELRKYEHKKAAVRKLREKYIEEKRRQLMQRNELLLKQDQQEKLNQQNHLEDREDGKSQDMHSNQYEKAQQEQQKIKNETLDFREGFRKLFEATGTSHVNEIITKYVTQDETVDSLTSLKQNYLDRIEKLSSERNMLKEQLDILKFEKADIQTRKQIDEIEKTTNDISIKCERFKLKYQRLAKILVNARAGIEHLSEKLEFFKVSYYPSKSISEPYQLAGRPSIDIHDDNLPEAIHLIIEKCKMIYQTVKTDPLFANNIQK